MFWGGNFIPAMTTLIRRECFDRVGVYDENLFYEDWDMWLRISQSYEFAYSEKVAAKYRLVSTSMVRSQWPRLVDAMCQMCVKHLKGGQLDAASRRIASKKLHAMAAISFQQKSIRHKKNLLDAMRYRPTFGILARCVLASCGGGDEQFEAMRSIFRGRKLPMGAHQPTK